MPDPTFTTPPDAPSRAVPSTFSSLTDAFLSWMVTFKGELTTAVSWFSSTASTVSTDAGTATTQAGIATTQAGNAATSAGEASASAGAAAQSVIDAANAGAAAAGASVWISAASYTLYDAVISPVDDLTYRAITTHTGVTTDPSADATNWLLLNADVSTIATLAGTETLTNKTVNLASNTLSGTTAQFNTALSDGSFTTLTGTETLTNKTLTAPAITAPTITGTIIEDIYAVTGTTPALEPGNGSVQTWTLTANSTPTDSFVAGEGITLMIDDGTAYTITWPTTTWVNNGGAAPTLATTGYTVIALWKVSTTLYGALVGDGS